MPIALDSIIAAYKQLNWIPSPFTWLHKDELGIHASPLTTVACKKLMDSNQCNGRKIVFLNTRGQDAINYLAEVLEVSTDYIAGFAYGFDFPTLPFITHFSGDIKEGMMHGQQAYEELLGGA